MDGTPVPAFQSRAVFHPTRYTQEKHTRLSCSEHKNTAKGRGDRREAAAQNGTAFSLLHTLPPGALETRGRRVPGWGLTGLSGSLGMSTTVEIPGLPSPSPSWINKERMVPRAGVPWEACCLEMEDQALGS